MRILVVIPTEVNGVVFHRLKVPFERLAYKADITAVNSLDGCSVDVLKNFNVVIFNRLDHCSDVDGNLERMKLSGCKYIYDMDDYYDLPNNHLLFDSYKHHGATEMIKKYIVNADMVWATHPYFKDVISKLNKNTHIIPNAIDLSQEQWKSEKNKNTDLFTFGWCGGINHYEDLEMLRPALKRMNELEAAICLGGYKNQPIWVEFDEWFANDYKNKYIRVNSSDTDNYGHIYNHFDCALIPLKDNKFNRCKSELKVLEAAAKGLPVIVSDVIPYTNICNESNSYLVHEDKSHKEWFKKIKHVLNNQEEAKEKAKLLQQDVSAYYDLDVINYRRLQCINTLLI